MSGPIKRKREGTPIEATAILPVDAAHYFIERDSAAFRALLAKTLNLGQYKFGETWKEGDSVFVRLITKPEFASWVPGAVQNAVASAEIEFHDIIEYRMEDIAQPPYRLHVRTESPYLGKKLDVQTTLTIEALDNGTCRQTLSGNVHVRMFGIGHLVEKMVCDSIQNTYRRLPSIVARWEAVREEAERRDDKGMVLAGRPPEVGANVEWIKAIMQAPWGSGEEQINKQQSDKQDDRQTLGISTPLPSRRGVPFDSAQECCGVVEPKEQEEEEEEIEPAAANKISINSGLLDTAAASPPPQQQKQSVPAHKNNNSALSTLIEPLLKVHRRTWSWDSAGAASDISLEPPTQLDLRSSGTSGAHTAWRRFNRDYTEWTHYWGVEVGVRATAVHKGARRAVHAALNIIRETLRVVLILFLLLFLRIGVLKVAPSSYKSRIRHRRTLSAPGVPSCSTSSSSSPQAALVSTSMPHSRHLSLGSSGLSGGNGHFGAVRQRSPQKSRFSEDSSRLSLETATRRTVKNKKGRLFSCNCYCGFCGGGIGTETKP